MMLHYSTKTKQDTKKKKKSSKQSEFRKSESWLKYTKGKTKYITNYAYSEDILTEHERIEKWQNLNTSDRVHASQILQKRKSMAGSGQHGAVLETTKKYSKTNNSPYQSKSK